MKLWGRVASIAGSSTLLRLLAATSSAGGGHTDNLTRCDPEAPAQPYQTSYAG